jgi:hypothetical protein
MTRDDAIRLAKEAGSDYYPGFPDTAFLQRFAALVAAEEIELCAKVCDEAAKRSEAARDRSKTAKAYYLYSAAESRSYWLAAAIRARKPA